MDFQGTADGLKVTASLGLADFKEDDSVDEVLRRVDEALYEAKRLERNRVVRAPRIKPCDEWETFSRTGHGSWEPRASLWWQLGWR